MEERTETTIRVSGDEFARLSHELDAEVARLAALSAEEQRVLAEERRCRGERALAQIAHEVPRGQVVA